MSTEALRLKLSLLTRGVRIEESALRLVPNLKPELRTRSGVSGGLDLVFFDHVHVNCPSGEGFVAGTPFSLRGKDEELWLFEGEREIARARAYPRPAYYDGISRDGTPFAQVGQMCSGDRICVGMTRHCFFWRRDLRCRYCSIGANAPRESPRKTAEGIAEAVAAAAKDSVLAARHVLVGGGTPNDEDRGATFAAEICAAIKRRLDLSIYVMIAPPRDLDAIARLHDSGADELGMNLEFFSEEALRAYAPGKLALIGLRHAWRALEEAVRVFGPVNARSIAIVGLEPAETTIAGAVRLAELGVMPILSPFRPLDGSDLAGAQGFPVEQLIDIHEEVLSRCRPMGVVPGPTCIPCQNNTLSLPFGPEYRYYGDCRPGPVASLV